MDIDCSGFNQDNKIVILKDVFCALAKLIDQAYYVLISLSILVLAYGIFKFIMKAGDAQARKEGTKLIFWSVIGIFIMVSVWGLVNIVSNTVSLDNDPLEVGNESIVPGYDNW